MACEVHFFGNIFYLPQLGKSIGRLDRLPPKLLKGDHFKKIKSCKNIKQTCVKDFNNPLINERTS